MTVVPSVDDRVLYRSESEPHVLRAADVTAVHGQQNGTEHVALVVFETWPVNYEQSRTVANAGQAPADATIEEIPAGTWRSITEIQSWRMLIGT